jgi:hypothetical protein
MLAFPGLATTATDIVAEPVTDLVAPMRGKL